MDGRISGRKFAGMECDVGYLVPEVGSDQMSMHGSDPVMEMT